MFHKHNYKEIARTFSGTAKIPGGTTGFTSREVERIIFGITTVLRKCEICQKIRQEELLGQITPH